MQQRLLHARPPLQGSLRNRRFLKLLEVLHDALFGVLSSTAKMCRCPGRPTAAQEGRAVSAELASLREIAGCARVLQSSGLDKLVVFVAFLKSV